MTEKEAESVPFNPFDVTKVGGDVGEGRTKNRELFLLSKHYRLNATIIIFVFLLYRIVLYRIVLYRIVLYCIVSYCIVSYCIVLYCIVLYCILLY